MLSNEILIVILGKQIYFAYLYPDDPIKKIWNLTKLSSDEYEVAAADKVLDLKVPLKNYNINDDVTLNVLKTKTDSGNRIVKGNEVIDSPDKEDIGPTEMSRADNDEEGYTP